jgi:hypothetical protein
MSLSPAITAMLEVAAERSARESVIYDIADEIAAALGRHVKRRHLAAAVRALSIIEARSSYFLNGRVLFRRAVSPQLRTAKPPVDLSIEQISLDTRRDAIMKKQAIVAAAAAAELAKLDDL